MVAISIELWGSPMAPLPPLWKVHPQEIGAGLCDGDGGSFCIPFCSFITISLWGLPLSPSRFRVYHPHQDGSGVPAAECCDRVRRLGPRPEGAHHLSKCPSGAGGRVWEHLRKAPAPWLPFTLLASCGLGSEPGTWSRHLVTVDPTPYGFSSRWWVA